MPHLRPFRCHAGRLRRAMTGLSVLSLAACTGPFIASEANSSGKRTETTSKSTDISADDSTRLCEKNFDDKTNAVGGTSSIYASWTLTPSRDTGREALGRLGVFVSMMPDAQLVSEEYHGARSAMDIRISSATLMHPMSIGFESIPDLRPLSVRVEYDADLGATSFVLRSLAKQQGERQRLRFLACTMLSIVGNAGLPTAPGKPYKRPRIVNPFKKNPQPDPALNRLKDRSLDMLLSRALDAGKSIVIMPTVQMDGKYTEGYKQLREERLVNYWLDLMGTVTWRRAGTEPRTLAVGNTTSLKERGLSGDLYNYPGGKKSTYRFFIVDPGTYELTGVSTDLRRSPMPDMTGTSWSDKSAALGTMSLKATKDTEYYSATEWQDAKFITQSYPTTYCSLVFTNGQCARQSWTSESVTHQTQAAGFAEVTRDREVDGLRLSMALTKPFASFTIAPGDVAVMDGFVLDGAAGSIYTDACKQSEDDIAVCAMRSLKLFRVAAAMPHIEEWRQSGMLGTVAAGLMAKARAVPVSIHPAATVSPEKPGTYEAGWAQRYTLKSPR
ncbi:hypothetical protein P3W33_06165 [Luteibacter sp. PPL552]